MAEQLVVPRALTRNTLRLGARLLAGRHPVFAQLLERHGPPPLWGRRPGFATLVRIILEQQVSLAAARTMYLRLSTSLGGMTPGQVLTAGEVVLRQLGLTGQKARYLRVLAEAIDTGALDLSAVARATDEEGRRALLVLPGIGPWTVDIYYLMALRRPDIWPQGDLALADALHRVLGLDHRPDSAQQRTLSDSWAPWRSIAARMFWQSYLATPRPRRQPAAVPP